MKNMGKKSELAKKLLDGCVRIVTIIADRVGNVKFVIIARVGHVTVNCGMVQKFVIYVHTNAEVVGNLTQKNYQNVLIASQRQVRQ